MRFHLDSRATRYCDVFPDIGKGEINVSVVHPGTIAAWHQHFDQQDWQIVLKGALQIGVCNCGLNRIIDPLCSDLALRNLNSLNYSTFNSDWIDKIYQVAKSTVPVVEWFILSERNANKGPIFIPAPLWHGSYNFTNDEAILAYHITNRYTGEDEYRASVEEMGWSWEKEVK